jgi:hypothetical protein
MAGCLELMAGWLGCWLASRNLLTEQLLTDSWGGGWLSIACWWLTACLAVYRLIMARLNP